MILKKKQTKNSELSPTPNQRTPKTAMSLDMGRH
jgi:hypothetical protein